MTPEILVVAGARPNFMKVAPVLRAFEHAGRVRTRFVHTGQHYDPDLDGRILRDLEAREPDHRLDIGAGAPSAQLARILEGMDALLQRCGPATVLVVGDVTSTLGATLAAANRDVPVVHVEAGLRSFDWAMPEERNRVIVDRLSRLRFATEPSAMANLADEGLSAGTHLVGNCMIDALAGILPEARRSPVLERLGVASRRYAVLTLHRPSNVDDAETLDRALASVAAAAAHGPVIFPVHPRTRAGLEGRTLPAGVVTTDPLGYVDFIALLAGSALALTDSGGIQEETTFLGVPCITLRRTTERPITVKIGTNEIVFDDPDRVGTLAETAYAGGWKRHSVPDLWDGRAAHRIADIVADHLCA